MSELMTGGEAVVAALEALGVECIFGVPSQQNLALFDALSRSTQIRVIGNRNEAGAAHAADGYARATGKLGVAIVSTGPGTANAVNGLYEAGFASSPVMLITTQIDRVHLGKSKGFIHDAEGQLAMLRSVTRRTDRVLNSHQIYETIIALAQDILSGRPQPGAIEIPTDLLAAPASIGDPLPILSRRDAPDPKLIAAAADLIGKAKRPLLWLGGGCVRAGAEDAARAFVEQFGIAFVTTLNGRSILPTDHPLAVGSTTHYPAFRQLLEEADLVLAVGTRFQAVASGFWTLPFQEKLIQIDIEPAMIGRNFPVRLGIVGDAGETLDALRGALGPVDNRDPAFLHRAAEVRTALHQDSATRIGPDHERLCDIADAVLPQDRFVVCDATMVGNTWGSYRLPIRHFRGFTYSTSLAIGVALPLAIGVAIGSGRRTLVVHGDGGVMLNVGELATAVETRAPMTLLVFNNRGYGVLKILQKAAGVEPFAVDLHTPDFVGLGKAMGMPAERVDSPDTFQAALERSVLIDGPSLIEVDLALMGEPNL